jgi:hypothetical protein
MTPDYSYFADGRMKNSSLTEDQNAHRSYEYDHVGGLTGQAFRSKTTSDVLLHPRLNGVSEFSQCTMSIAGLVLEVSNRKESGIKKQPSSAL